MLKFGMPTLIETETIEQCAALCADSGLSFIEMNMNLPQYQVQTMDVARLSRVGRELFFTNAISFVIIILSIFTKPNDEILQGRLLYEK